MKKIVKILITANGYPDIGHQVELTEKELGLRLDSCDLWLCVAGCNQDNDDLPIYHANGDYTS